MFNVGPEKILIILLIALIVLGPRELPDAARKIGNVMRELRRLSAGFEHELRSALDGVTSPTQPGQLSGHDDEPATESRADRDESDSAA